MAKESSGATKAKTKGRGTPGTDTGKKRGRPKGSRSRSRQVPENVIISRDLASRYKADTSWMIIELHDQDSEMHVVYDALECELLRIFGYGVDFFIPAYVEKVKDKMVGIDLIGGYVFVERTEESESLAVRMQSTYLKGEIRGRNRADKVTGARINDFKKQIVAMIKSLAPKKGDMVIPKVGTFKSMEGKVTSVARDRKTASVVFKRSSRIVQAPISVLNMEIQS